MIIHGRFPSLMGFSTSADHWTTTDLVISQMQQRRFHKFQHSRDSTLFMYPYEPPLLSRSPLWICGSTIPFKWWFHITNVISAIKFFEVWSNNSTLNMSSLGQGCCLQCSAASPNVSSQLGCSETGELFLQTNSKRQMYSPAARWSKPMCLSSKAFGRFPLVIPQATIARGSQPSTRWPQHTSTFCWLGMLTFWWLPHAIFQGTNAVISLTDRKKGT